MLKIKKIIIALILQSIMLFMSNAAWAYLVVIGNPNIKVDQLTADQIKNLYLGKPLSLKTKDHLYAIDQSDSANAHQYFYRKIIGWDNTQAASYWSGMVFRGEGNPPTQVGNAADVINAVASTAGAITYVDSSDLSTSTANVKVLFALGGPVNVEKKSAINNPEPVNNLNSNSNLSSNSIAPSPVTVQVNVDHPIQSASTSQQQQAAVETIDSINQSLAQAEKNQVSAPVANNTPNITHSTAGFFSDPSVPEGSDESLWKVLADQFQLPAPVDKPEMRREILSFLSNRKVLNEMLNEARPYLYYVLQETKKRHMPAEFALLPIVESGYDPYSYSQVGATGLWQMMPGTASSVGLNINWWYDARRDVIVSTQAALNYLDSLHGMFHDWLLAAAAYDAGDGAVQAAREYNQRNGRSTDFWSLPLTEETKRYSPRLLAIAEIIRHPDLYHVQLPPLTNRPYFSAINMTCQLTWEEAGVLAGVSADSLRRLNAEMLRFATPEEGQYTILIPKSVENTFLKRLALVAGKKHITWHYHEVRSGETIETIAHLNHISVARLDQVNGLQNAAIYAGQSLLVPMNLHRTFTNPVASVSQGLMTPVTTSNEAVAQETPIITTPTASTPPSLKTPNPMQLALQQSSFSPPAPTALANNQTEVLAKSDNQPSLENSKKIKGNETLKDLLGKIYSK